MQEVAAESEDVSPASFCELINTSKADACQPAFLAALNPWITIMDCPVQSICLSCTDVTSSVFICLIHFPKKVFSAAAQFLSHFRILNLAKVYLEIFLYYT